MIFFIKASIIRTEIWGWHCIGKIINPLSFCLNIYLSMRFSNKVCIVTGAGSGIGRAAALQFASEGGFAAVVDRNETGGKNWRTLILLL